MKQNELEFKKKKKTATVLNNGSRHAFFGEYVFGQKFVFYEHSLYEYSSLTRSFEAKFRTDSESIMCFKKKCVNSIAYGRCAQTYLATLYQHWC